MTNIEYVSSRSALVGYWASKRVRAAHWGSFFLSLVLGNLICLGIVGPLHLVCVFPTFFFIAFAIETGVIATSFYLYILRPRLEADKAENGELEELKDFHEQGKGLWEYLEQKPLWSWEGLNIPVDNE